MEKHYNNCVYIDHFKSTYKIVNICIFSKFMVEIITSAQRKKNATLYTYIQKYNLMLGQFLIGHWKTVLLIDRY